MTDDCIKNGSSASPARAHHPVGPAPAPLPAFNVERLLILDALRGFALLGICLANFPEFALYTFQKPEVAAAMPTAMIDEIVKYLQYIFIDGKFYSIFSLLFGIGFSIQIMNAGQRGCTGTLLFYRRLTILLVIGVLHLALLWTGDILILYALVGMLLPLFRRMPGPALLTLSLILVLCPIAMDGLNVLSSGCIDPAGWLPPLIKHFHDLSGINDDNFGVWLVEGRSYENVLHFALGGSFIRLQELLGSHRAFKVLGLFLLGLYIGRKRLFTDLGQHKPLLKKASLAGLIIGFPASCVYAWNAMNGRPMGLIGGSAAYALGVIPMALAYVSLLCLLFINNHFAGLFKLSAAAGRMALTNYISQSIIGMMLFYGVGFRLGASLGLVYVEWIALAVFVLQAVFSMVWMQLFRYGPLEWIWRMLTYGAFFKITR